MDPSSSTSYERKKYDVFLSFRGSDTRYSFTSHVYAALRRKNIATFVDNDLSRGEEISPAILSTIEQSKVALIIFSQNYASSPWCLEELEHILRCRKTHGQIVLPVFYQVDPSHVGEQIGDFGVAFLTLKEKFKENMENWKVALTEAGNLSGWVSSDVRPESKLIEAMVRDILKKLSPLSPRRSTSLIGIDIRIKRIISLLCMDSLDVRIVGIWGMGGIGKTTIARAVFNQISAHFEGVHFLPNVRDELRRCSLIQLQNKLLSRVLNEESQDVDTLSLEDTFLMERLGHTKVLIVLDDVDDSIEVLELLGGQRDLFGQGSRILITSRDKQVLKNVADKIYKVEGLNPSEALQLFSLNAFKKNYPTSDYLLSSERIVNYAQGNPLALRVLGLALYNRSKKDWASTLSKLSNVSNAKILNVLRISYDGLDSEEKKIFLDIACFYKGERRDYVTDILESYYASAHLSISILEDKSLITIYDDKLEMHDLLQEMGRSIVCDESTQDPGKRSRLWHSDDVHYVLSKKKGTEAIEGIVLDISKAREMYLEPDAFARMEHLRVLKFYVPDVYGNWRTVHLPHGLQSLSNELIYLHWYKFPMKSFPPNFCAENLVELSLPYSNAEELWTGVQNLVNLKWINLFCSRYLVRIPDLSKAQNVVSINLEGCERLFQIPLPIQHLQKLEYFNLNLCKNLQILPSLIGSQSLCTLKLLGCQNVNHCPEVSGNLEILDLTYTAVGELPESIKWLKHLRILCLTCCSNVKRFPMVPENLEELYLRGTSIKEVPLSIESLSKLVILNLRDCKELLSLPSTICKLKSLQTLSLCGCLRLDSFLEILEPMNVVEINFDDCKNLKRLPDSIHNLKSLIILHLSGTSIEELPATIVLLNWLSVLKVDGCINLVRLPSSFQTMRSLQRFDASNSPSGLQLLPLVGLWSLTCLHLRRCYHRELPMALGSLFTLEYLDLSGNNFKSLPPNIKKLHKLKSLILSDCKKLQCLPELPPSLQCLQADECISLETLSGNSECKFLKLSFVNCSKLGERACRGILANALLRVTKTQPSWKSTEGGDEVNVLFPGSEVPEQFSDQSTGTLVSLHSPQKWLQIKGIAFCVVFATNTSLMQGEFAPTTSRFECKISVKANNCKHNNLSWYGCCDVYNLSLVDSDHVLVWSEHFKKDSFSENFGNDVSLEFHSAKWFQIRRCGILVF